jgi:transcriptional pleiotropic regulator of transition state genes
MKSTGIVRKLDHLGRIVLPKELRRTLDLPEGTPMEIYIDGSRIVLRKYQPSEAWTMSEMQDALTQAAGETATPPVEYLKEARAHREGEKG